MRFDTPKPIGPGGGRRRRLLPLGILIFVGLLCLVAAVSAWNYYDITLRQVEPTSMLSEGAVAYPLLVEPPSGRIVWSFDAGEAILAPALVHDGTVLIATGRRAETGRIVALDLDSGVPIWTYTLLGVSDFRPSAAGDLVYVVARDGRIIALDRHTGLERWTYDAGEILLGSPVIRNGNLYVASDGVHTIDAMTGDLLWIHETEGGRTVSPLAYHQGIIAVLSEGNHLNLVDAAKRKRRLTTRLWFGGAGTPAVNGDSVVVSGDRGAIQNVELWARDIPMEKALRFWWTKLWVYKSAPRPPDPVGYSWHHRGIGGLSARVVAADDDRLFLITRNPDHSGTVVAIDSISGEVVWEYPSRTVLAETAILTRDMLVVANAGGDLIGIDPSTGRDVWGFTLSLPINSVTVAGSDALLVTSDSGSAHLIR